MQWIHSVFYWLQFSKLTIVHTEENHFGICRGFGAQGQKRLISYRICLCDLGTHYTFNWKWEKKPDIGQQVMTKTELLGGSETTVSVNSVHAGPDLMQKQHESALPWLDKPQWCCLMEWLAVFQDAGCGRITHPTDIRYSIWTSET